MRRIPDGSVMRSDGVVELFCGQKSIPRLIGTRRNAIHQKWAREMPQGAPPPVGAMLLKYGMKDLSDVATYLCWPSHLRPTMEQAK